MSLDAVERVESQLLFHSQEIEINWFYLHGKKQLALGKLEMEVSVFDHFIGLVFPKLGWSSEQWKSHFKNTDS